MKILPSSEPDAIMWSLKGCLGAELSVQKRKYAPRPAWRQAALMKVWEEGKEGKGSSILPVGIQDHSGVAAEQRNHVGQLSFLVQGNNGKRAATARLPIDREVLRVDLIKDERAR